MTRHLIVLCESRFAVMRLYVYSSSTFYVNYMCTSQEARAFVNEECDVASAPQTCERPEGAGVFPEIGQTDVDGEENAARRDTIFELWWMPMLASLFQQARFF